MKRRWSWRTATRIGPRMRSSRINARDSTGRREASPCDPVHAGVSVVEDLQKGRGVELRDHRRVHRGRGLPGCKTHPRLHVLVNPYVRAVPLTGRRIDPREASVRVVQGGGKERGPRSIPCRVQSAEPEDRRGAVMVRHNEPARMIPGPIRGIQGRGDRPLPPTGERGGRRDARERIRHEDEADGYARGGSDPSSDWPQIQEANKADTRENGERHDEVLHVAIGNEDAWRDDNPHDRGSEEDDQPGVHRQSIPVEVEELAARRGKRNEEHERDEIEEALWRDSERRPGDAEEDRHEPENQDGSDRGGVCGSTIAEPRIPGPVPPSDSGPRIDDRPEGNESQPEQDEDRPPRPDVHVGEDELSEGRRVDEPVHERPGEEETRIRDLSFRPGRPSPWASEPLNDDLTEDHEELEVEGQMVRPDQGPRDEDERDHGRAIGSKAEKEEEAREREQISDGRGGRVRGRICVGYRADQEGGREEGDTVLARDTPCDQEDRDDGQSAQDRHEEVQHGRKVEAGEMDQPSLQEEDAREIRIRDAPSAVHRRDVAGPDKISEDREVFARVRTPIEERP